MPKLVIPHSLYYSKYKVQHNFIYMKGNGWEFMILYFSQIQ